MTARASPILASSPALSMLLITPIVTESLLAASSSWTVSCRLPRLNRSGIGLQAEKAGRQIGEAARKLAARYLDAEPDSTALVEADQVEGVLADIETNRGDGIG
jgi:hypothetical protein